MFFSAMSLAASRHSAEASRATTSRVKWRSMFDIERSRATLGPGKQVPPGGERPSLVISGQGADPPSGAQERLDGRIVAALHRRFDQEALAIAVDGRDRLHAPGLAVGDQAASRSDASGDLDPIPGFGMSDVVDGDVVVLAPEEGHGAIRLPRAQHSPVHMLSLAFGDDPVLDPDGPAAARVGKTRDVSGRPDALRAGPQRGVDEDAGVHLQPGLLRDLQP